MFHLKDTRQVELKLIPMLRQEVGEGNYDRCRRSVPLLFVIRYWRLGVSAVEKNSGHSEARYFSEADSELIPSVS